MEKKIQTLHPETGKKNKAIPATQYNIIKDTIVTVLKTSEPTYTELAAQVSTLLRTTFPGNIKWYIMVVKLDIEARKIILRTRSKPEKYKLNTSEVNLSV